MPRLDPIVGRYVTVLFGGIEYRVFYEEAGQGIPLVCLHTAGTDSREWRHHGRNRPLPDVRESDAV